MAIKKDKPRPLGELLGKVQDRTSAGAAVWRERIDKPAHRGVICKDAGILTKLANP